MDAPKPWWQAWWTQVKQFFSDLHGHQQQMLVWMGLGVVLSGSAVLPRRTASGALCCQ